MRWERLWDDLGAQADAWDRDDFDAEVDDRARVENASLTLMDRFRACSGRRLQVGVRGGRRFDGTLVAHGSDWVALQTDPLAGGMQVIVPTAAVLTVRGLGARAVPVAALGPVAGRVSLAMVLRRAAEGAQQVCLHLEDGRLLRGDVGRVGRDYVDVVDDDALTWSVVTGAIVAVTAP
ncbi:MAG: hypothetical protein WCA29_10745 [Jiangellales bacterium]